MSATTRKGFKKSTGMVIGVVGKPSAGKSTFLNAVTRSQVAKTGAYPFTTIEPNYGVGYFVTPCPCSEYGVAEAHAGEGVCVDGQREVAVGVLDVAGLVPGASEGLGKGVRFLNDLCGADVLVHVVDVSGKTDACGEACEGYDPMLDVEWLPREIEAWVMSNAKDAFPGAVRRHTKKRSRIVDTMQRMFSGYGIQRAAMAELCASLDLSDPCDLASWDDEALGAFVAAFVAFRFRIILALNKIDSGEAAARNAARISRQVPDAVPMSAMAECVLQAAAEKGYVEYRRTMLDPMGLCVAEDAPAKWKSRVDNIVDRILFRYGRTGVQDVIQHAVAVRGLSVLYIVDNLVDFGSRHAPGTPFQDVFLVPPTTSVGRAAVLVHKDLVVSAEDTADAGGDATPASVITVAQKADGREVSVRDPIGTGVFVLRICVGPA